MSLSANLSALAQRTGQELKSKIDASHPGLARAWVCFGCLGQQVVVQSSYNVSHVIRMAKGSYRVVFATPMPDSRYCWTAQTRSRSQSGKPRMAMARAEQDRKTRQYLEICCASARGRLVDSDEINVMVLR